MNLAKQIKLIIILFISISTYAVANDYPILTKIVTDNANIFTPSEFNNLQKKLKHFETNTTNQLVIVTINNLNGESIESYAFNIFNRNRLGQRKKDNGILVLFSDAENKIRIEVGYGLEGILTDVVCSRIIRDLIIPEFKNKQYYKGINLATDKIIELINNPIHREELNENSKLPLLAVFILGFFLVLFLTIISAAIFIGRRAIIKVFKKSTKVYKGMLTGEIGLFYFPLLLMLIILQQVLIFILIIGILSTIPLFYVAIMQNWSSPDINLLYVSYTLEGLGLFFFFLLPISLAFIQIIKTNKSQFSISLKSNKEYMAKNFPSKNASFVNNDLDNDLDNDTNEHFSGRGGSSGGGGSSGSW